MKYGSICSGIEAATVAWQSLGFQAQFYSEIDPFCNSLLSYYYPNIKNYNDFTNITDEEKEAIRSNGIDILIGGTPCQSFSIAGERDGMDDSRGQLAIEFIKLASSLRARWTVFENVPGLLSSNSGKDFRRLLFEMGKCGYGFAYRILNAQYFGVPQRRRRIFLIGYLGDWRYPAAVLFERESLQRRITPERAERQSSPTISKSGSGTNRAGGQSAELGFYINQEIAGCNTTGEGSRYDSETCSFISSNSRVRRLMPIEIERLFGFKDNYTLVPYRKKLASDKVRYESLGNSMAVPVIRWPSQRITAVEKILKG